MQPDQPYSPPTMPTTSSQDPNYDFLNQGSKNTSKIPFAGNSMKSRIFVVTLFVVLLFILFAVVKSLLSSSPINKTDYTAIVDRQQEMLHILSVDVTQITFTQLSPPDQNFSATAKAALETDQQKTVSYMSDFKIKVNGVKLAKLYDSSIDQNFKNALATNTFDTVFKSEMSSQLTSYQQELSTAYNATTLAGGKKLLKIEDAEAKLLVTALNSTTS
ncbi:MAG: hypothetical protein WDN66_02270 [Candidatus Saccharibacteria bacterium]